MKEELNAYISYLNNNLDKTIDYSKIKNLLKEASTNPDLEQLLKNLQMANPNERNQLIDKWLKNQEAKLEEEVIANAFGIDVSNIKHYKLKNEKEIFVFYDPLLKQTITLENKKDENLKEQLKRKQQENILYQKDNDANNTYQMLMNQRIKEGEIKFIPIAKMYEYPYLLDKLTNEEKVSLDYLIKNKDHLNIDKINIENVLGLTKDGKILESYYSRKNQEFLIETPEENVYGNNQKTNEDTKGQETIIDEQTKEHDQENINKESEFENMENNDIEKILKEEIKDEEKVKFILDKLALYDEYPELMEYLPYEDQQFYQKYLVIYRKNKELQKEIPYQKVYKKEEKRAGFIDPLILSLITGFAGGVFISLIIFLS